MPATTHRPPKRPGVPRVVLLVESSRSSGRELLRGIASYSRHHGPWAFYWEPAGLEGSRPGIQDLDADGFILRDSLHLDEILSRKLPAVVVGHRLQEMDGPVNVITDSDAIGTLAAEHLLQAGLRHFAFCGFPGLPWSDLRGHAFAQRLERDGHPVVRYASPLHADDPIDWRQERADIARWLRGLPKPVGLMACNDDRGQQVIEACKSAGIAVPDQVAVLGADNDDLVCDLSDPPMSSVGIAFERAGYQAAEALDRLMRGKPPHPQRIVVQATGVITRRSTDIIAVEDAGVGAALRFIRDNAHRPISVPQVARAAGLSRRVLEKRIRIVLRRSALEEIRRARAERIGRLLLETRRTVSDIALTLGFESPDHVARYFRQATGHTPLAYRRRFAAL